MTFGQPSFWSPGRTAMAIAMWKDNYTASEIGSRLGCTRNAVIGRLSRLHVARKNLTRPNNWRPHKERPRPPNGRETHIQPREEKVELPVDKIVLPPETRAGSLVEFKDLQSHHCRWPVAGEPGPAMLCCGASGAQFPIRPYCAFHEEVAHG